MNEFLDYGQSPHGAGDRLPLTDLLRVANQSNAPLIRTDCLDQATSQASSRAGITGDKLTRAVVISTAAGVTVWYIARKLPGLPNVLRGTFAMGEAESLLAPSLGQRLKFALFHGPFIHGPNPISPQEVLRRGKLAAGATLENVLTLEGQSLNRPFQKLLEASAEKTAAATAEKLSVLELGSSSTTLVPRTLGGRMGRYVSTDIYWSDLLKQRELLKSFPEVAAKSTQIVADTRALPFESQSFDLVVARFHPPFTVPNPKDMVFAVRETARVLRPNGLLVLDSHRLGYAGKAVRSEVQRLFDVAIQGDAAKLLALKLR